MRTTSFAAAAAVLALTVALAPGAAAAATLDPSATLTVSPLQGPPGTQLTVSSPVPCKDSSGTIGKNVVVLLYDDIALRADPENVEPVATTAFGTSADGAWSGKITLPASARAGIRVGNAVITRLAGMLPLGVPVQIVT